MIRISPLPRRCTAGLLTGLLVACSPAGPTVEIQEVTRRTARPGVPTLTATLGESPLGLGPEGSDGFLYVPSSYRAEQPMPLLIGLHGSGGRAVHWRSWNEPAESRGFVFLAIDARGSTWDRTNIGFFGPDVEFLDQALQHTFERVAIDPRQITLIGFSDGASWALSAGLPNGDLFTQVAAFAPGYFAPADVLRGRPAVWVAHGTQDRSLPVQNTLQVIVPQLRALSLDVTYLEFDGGHQIPAEVAESGIDWITGRD